AGEGGFETMSTTLVSGSAPRAAIPCKVVSPPTAAWRSRPPVPIAWETPEPRRWMRLVSSWIPVPEAPTTPMGPRRTRFAKPRPETGAGWLAAAAGAQKLVDAPEGPVRDRLGTRSDRDQEV